MQCKLCLRYNCHHKATHRGQQNKSNETSCIWAELSRRITRHSYTAQPVTVTTQKRGMTNLMASQFTSLQSSRKSCPEPMQDYSRLINLTSKDMFI